MHTLNATRDVKAEPAQYIRVPPQLLLEARQEEEIRSIMSGNAEAVRQDGMDTKPWPLPNLLAFFAFRSPPLLSTLSLLSLTLLLKH